MSILTELPSSWYQDDAFQGFSDALCFTPQTARALMWLSQLAYEDADSGKAREAPDVGFTEAHLSGAGKRRREPGIREIKKPREISAEEKRLRVS